LENAKLEDTGLSTRLKLVRKQSGLSQKALSSKLGFSPVLYSQFEAGWRWPRSIYIKAVCNLFEIREEWLLSGEGEMRLPEDDRSEINTIASEIMYVLKNSPKEVGESLLAFLKSVRP
jgi:transcriptional regulator with XRE-family HTH domain